MRRAVTFVCWLSACHAPAASDTDAAADPADPPTRSPYAPDAPAWTAAAMTDALTTALSAGLPDATSLGATYVATVALRDDTCPTFAPTPEEGLGPWRADACTTAGGITFDGDVGEHTATTLGDDGVTTFTRLILGAGTIADADGVGWHHSGQADLVCDTSPSGVSWSTAFSGTFDAAWGEGWLVDGGLASVFADGARTDALTTIHLLGGVRTGGVVLHFEDVALSEGADACALTGELRVEDPTGWWWRLAFDGGCDACATRAWEDVDGGEVCLGETLLSPLRALAEGTCS